MTHRHLLSLLVSTALIFPVTVPAADVTPLARLLIGGNHPLSRSEEQPPYLPMMLQVSSDSVAEKLAELGVVVYNGRGDMLLTSVPREVVEQVLSMPGIHNVSMSGDMSRCLDKAREMSRVDLARTKIDCPGGLTGKGVVAGIADIGFDAGHIAFSDNLKAIYDYRTDQGERTAIETPSALAEWSTDRAEECHATHVAAYWQVTMSVMDIMVWPPVYHWL